MAPPRFAGALWSVPSGNRSAHCSSPLGWFPFGRAGYVRPFAYQNVHQFLKKLGETNIKLSGLPRAIASERGRDVTDFQAEDVVDVLTTDHREVEDLIAEIRACSGEECRDKTDMLIAELVRHSVAEEMHVYPAMEAHLPDGEAAVAHDVQEHKGLETIMKELEAADVDGPGFAVLIDELAAVLRDHVQDEESDQFPKLREAIPRDHLVALAEKVRAAKKAAPTRPHPSAPNSELFHKSVGPGVGLIDRLRDKLTSRSTS
jgi:hemerythrin superfamily protein